MFASGIFGAKVQTNGKQIFFAILCYEKPSSEMFSALSRSLGFENNFMRINQSRATSFATWTQEIKTSPSFPTQ